MGYLVPAGCHVSSHRELRRFDEIRYWGCTLKVNVLNNFILVSIVRPSERENEVEFRMCHCTK
jgi:hypothetical protein